MSKRELARLEVLSRVSKQLRVFDAGRLTSCFLTVHERVDYTNKFASCG